MTVTDIKGGIEQFLQNDGLADLVLLHEGLGLIGKVASVILGIFVLVTVVGIPIIIAIELAYINFPILRLSTDKLYDRLKGRAGRIAGLMLRDAKQAVKESQTVHKDTSVNFLYLKIKIKAIMLCIILVAFSISGGATLIDYLISIIGNFLI